MSKISNFVWLLFCHKYIQYVQVFKFLLDFKKIHYIKFKVNQIYIFKILIQLWCLYVIKKDNCKNNVYLWLQLGQGGGLMCFHPLMIG
jgi:hypothetical protein